MEAPNSPRFGRRNLRKELERILERKDLCLIFRDWLKAQKCDENLNFWVEVQLYSQYHKELFNQQHDNEDVPFVLSKAIAIYQKYLGQDSPYLLNLDSEIMQPFRDSFQLATSLTSKTDLQASDIYFLGNIFHEIQSNVFQILETCCIQKFLESDLYKRNGHEKKAAITNSKHDSKIITDSMDNLNCYFNGQNQH